jgi:hypothetical protein
MLHRVGAGLISWSSATSRASEPRSSTSRPVLRHRIAFALAVALAAALYCWLDVYVLRPVYPHRDFDRSWLAARLVLDHQNPYALIGPGKAYPWQWPFFYPITAAIAMVPLAWLPLAVARLVFVALSAGTFAFVITRESWARWPAVLSWCALVSAASGQWAPLLIAATVSPWSAGLLAAKPNLALALLAAQNRKVWIGAAVGGMILALAAFVLFPAWLSAWRHQMSGFDTPPPIVSTLGFLMVLALIRWRDPRARLLLVMSIVPHTDGLYEELALFLVPSRLMESFALVIGSYVAAIVQGIAIQGDAAHVVYHAALARTGIIVCLYIPALIMLRRRHHITDDDG